MPIEYRNTQENFFGWGYYKREMNKSWCDYGNSSTIITRADSEISKKEIIQFQGKIEDDAGKLFTRIFTAGMAGDPRWLSREKVVTNFLFQEHQFETLEEARTARNHIQAEGYAATAERLKAEANRLEGQTKINKLMDVITSYDRAIELNTAKAGEYRNTKASILEEIGDELYREGLEILEEAEEDVINGRYIEALEKFRQAEEKYKKALELGEDVQQHIVETRELIRVSHLFSETIAELERLKGLTDNEKKAEGLDSLLKSLQVGLEGINEGIELFAGIYEVKTAIENQINIYLESIVSSPEGHERYGHTIVLSVTGVTYGNELQLEYEDDCSILGVQSQEL